MKINELGDVMSTSEYKGISKSEYKQSEKKQTIHRSLNTILAIGVLVMGVLMINPVIESTNDLYEQVSGIEAQKIVDSEIAQIVADEGYRSRPYKDSRGLWTIGFGHLIKKGEKFKDLTPHKAVEMLRKDYKYASDSVENKYPWAEGEVKLVLINMTFQMGVSGVSKFENTISYMEQGKYDKAAGEMLDSKWASQTPNRAARLAGRIMKLGD